MSFEIVIDAHKPATLARFWQDALTSYKIRSYDEEEIARLATLRLTSETDTSVALDGDGPTIWFQKSNDVTSTRNRIHFDLKLGDPRTESKRLLLLGATFHVQCDDHIVMHDPEGNQFCLFEY